METPSAESGQPCPLDVPRFFTRKPFVITAPVEDKIQQTVRYVYLRLHLTTEELTRGCRERLEAYGIECLSNGRAFEAYGIAGVTLPPLENLEHVLEATIDAIRSDPDIVWCTREEPPCSK